MLGQLPAIRFEQVFELFGLGVAAGTLGGLLGVGGGLILIPALLLIFKEPYGPGSLHVYKLTALVNAIVLSIPAAVRHTRAKAVVYPMLGSIVLPAFGGALAGVWVAQLFSDQHTYLLRRVFGGFMVTVAAFNTWQAWGRQQAESSPRDSCPVPRRRGLIGAVVGLPAGFVSGLLGIGGGVWAVPAQHLGLGVRMRHAIANSTLAIVFVAAVAAVSQTWTIATRMPALHAGNGWWLALWLTPGSLLGGWLGAGLTHRLSTRWLGYAFHLLLAVTGLRLFFS